MNSFLFFAGIMCLAWVQSCNGQRMIWTTIRDITSYNDACKSDGVGYVDPPLAVPEGECASGVMWTHETPTLLRRRAYEHTDCTGSVLSDTTHTDGACSSTQWRRYYSGSPGSNYWSPVYLQPFNCSVLGWIRLDYYATSSSCGGTPMRSIYIPAGGCANGYLVRMTSATTATIEQYSTNSQFYCLNIISSLSTSVTHDECISPPPQNVPYKGDWGLTTSSTVTVGPGWSSNSTASVRVVFSSELSPQMLVNYQGICYGPGAPHGQDGPACSGSQTICNGACTDLNTDPNHCGQCGRRCNVPGITSCVAGVCTGGGGGGGGVTSSSTGSNNSTSANGGSLRTIPTTLVTVVGMLFLAVTLVLF